MPGARSQVIGWDSGEPGWEQKPQQWLPRVGFASGQGGEWWWGRPLEVSGPHLCLKEYVHKRQQNCLIGRPVSTQCSVGDAQGGITTIPNLASCINKITVECHSSAESVSRLPQGVTSDLHPRENGSVHIKNGSHDN